MKTKEEQIHISQISAGDTILHNGEMCTVSNTNIKNSTFMGKTLFGDSYRSGTKLVTRLQFIKK